MSREWTDFAWSNGPQKPTDFVVFLCLAQHANFSGQAYPSWNRIVTQTRLSRSTAARALASLQTDGWLTSTGGTGRGNLRTYQLIKRVSTGDPLEQERVSTGDPLEQERVSTGDPLEQERVSNRGLKGVKNASLYRLTKREPKYLKTSTYGANEKQENEVSPNLPLQMKPPDPLVNPEIRNCVDLIVCASPSGVIRNLTTYDVTPADRVAVLEAAKAESHQNGIDLGTALQGLLQVVEAQVAASPPEQLQFLGEVTTYFKKRNYRKSKEHLSRGGNGNGNFKSKSERHEETLRKFLGRDSDPAGTSVVDLTASRPGRISAARLPKRVM